MNDDKNSEYREDKNGLQHLIREQVNDQTEVQCVWLNQIILAYWVDGHQDAMITGGANDHDDNGKKEEMEDENDEEEDDDDEEEDEDEEEACCAIHYFSQLKEELGRYFLKINH